MPPSPPPSWPLPGSHFEGLGAECQPWAEVSRTQQQAKRCLDGLGTYESRRSHDPFLVSPVLGMVGRMLPDRPADTRRRELLKVPRVLRCWHQY